MIVGRQSAWLGCGRRRSLSRHGALAQDTATYDDSFISYAVHPEPKLLQLIDAVGTDQIKILLVDAMVLSLSNETPLND